MRFRWGGREYVRGAVPTKAGAARLLSKAHAKLAEGADAARVLVEVFGDACGPNVSFANARDAYVEYAKARKRPGTLAADEQRLDVIAEEAWAKGPMHRIRREDVAAFVDKIKASGRRGKPCSAGTANRYLSVISAVLQWAVREGTIPANVARGAERYSEKGSAREVYLTAQEAHALTVAASEAFRSLVTFALLTGCRRGEILALRWKDVDLEEARVHVRAENSKTAEGRTIDLAASLVTVLRALRAAQGVPRGGRENPVFQLADGRAWTGEAVRHHFESARARCKVLPEDKARVRFHDLRHTFASLALKKGVSIATLSRMLGHRSIHMTMRYAHLCPDDRRLAAAAVGEALASGAVAVAKGTSGGTNGDAASEAREVEAS